MAFELSRLAGGSAWGPFRPGSATNTPAIDSNYVHQTSGDAFVVLFTAPVSQSSATLTFYAYVVSVTGTPDFSIGVFDEFDGTGDADRPDDDGSDIGSSASTASLSSADNGTWVQFTVTVSLTVGKAYWVVVKNTHGTPASNYATFRYRGALDSFLGTIFALYQLRSGYTLDGFATDPTLPTSPGIMGCAVLKFADGTLFGFPYVDVASHASNPNSRGIRLTFDEDIVVSGIESGFGTSTIYSAAGIYTTAGATVAETAATNFIKNRSALFRFAPVTLSGGVAYDFVVKFASSSTVGPIYSMGETEANVPADVLACRPRSISHVDGDIGSFTPDTSKLCLLNVIIDNHPAISGGGGGQTSHCFIG